MHVKLTVVLPCLLVILLGLSGTIRGTSFHHPQEAGESSDHGDAARGPAMSHTIDARTRRTVGRVELPLSVDGAQNPEQIPDYIAYRHFISVTAVSASASGKEVFRRDAILARIGLSKADQDSYLRAVASVREELVDTDQRMQAVHSDSGTMNELRRQKGQVLDNAATRVLSSLSAAVEQLLQAKINESIKTHIRIYGDAIAPGESK